MRDSVDDVVDAVDAAVAENDGAVVPVRGMAGPGIPTTRQEIGVPIRREVGPKFQGTPSVQFVAWDDDDTEQQVDKERNKQSHTPARAGTMMIERV